MSQPSTHVFESHRHPHVYLGDDHARNERRAWWVVGITAAMMLLEIGAGLAFGSMALLADGVHMATHAGALAISGFAYAYARRHQDDPRYTFGTGKVGDLAGFASALLLGVFSIGIALQSFERLVQPVTIHYREAIAVAVLGLVVNLICALLLKHDHGHAHHGHDHDHDQGHSHADHNLRSAYLHVLADALTSVMAIIALLAGSVAGWAWMDPAMGIIGAVVIARWSWGLMRDTGRVLLDASADPKLAAQIHQRVERNGDRIADLHLWRVGPGRFAAIVVVVTAHDTQVAAYQQRLDGLDALAHVTIEVQACADCAG
jgi:cation diffusion facilitator family transporter